MKIRAMSIIMLVLAIGLLVYSSPAMATHDKTSTDSASGHWDNWTINDTDNQGLKGYLFIPSFLRLKCDQRAIHGPRVGFSKDSGAFVVGPGDVENTVSAEPVFGNNGGCTQQAWSALSAWTVGGFFDARGGTPFIPASGDHHRSGGRLLQSVNFSAGQWLTGFAPALGTFPFYSLVGVPGAGESPEGILEYCLHGIPPYNVIPTTINQADFNGDGSTGANGGGLTAACNDWASLGAALIMVFTDHHGEPLTPGKFPRYIPHQRQGWPSTVVTKYTASSQNEGHGISQLFESSARFLDGSDSTTPVTWYSMSDESAKGCSDWCEWSYNPVTHTLCKVSGASVKPGVQSTVAGNGTCSGSGSPVTTAQVIDSIGGLANNGVVTTVVTLNKFEKSPVVIYQKLGQWVEMDTDGSSPNFSVSFVTTNNPTGFTHNQQTGTDEESGQVVWYEHWGLSGPNAQSEESADPYTWIMCGSRGASFGEADCENDASDALDTPKTGGGNHVFWAVIDPPGVSLGGLDPLQRYGPDLRPTTGVLSCLAGDQSPTVEDPTICGNSKIMVACTPGGAALPDDPNTQINEANIVTSNCESDPGPDKVYGTIDDGTIFYREATENKLRAFVRENRATAFSFINGIGVNHPDLCGSPNQCADSPATGTRQVMFQNIAELGGVLSCFNCSALPQHSVPSHGFDQYSFVWTPLPGLTIPDIHDTVAATQAPGPQPASGSIPATVNPPSNGF